MDSTKANQMSSVASLRRQLNMTQEEFAHAIGVTVSTVNRWENGHVEPSRLARKAMEGLSLSYGKKLSEPSLSEAVQ